MESKSAKKGRKAAESAATEARAETARLRDDTARQRTSAQKILIKGIRARLGGGFSSRGRDDILG